MHSYVSGAQGVNTTIFVPVPGTGSREHSMDSPRESQGTSILTSLFSHQLQASIVYKYSFLSRSLEAWNKLNNEVIEATTTERFSKRVVSEIDFDLKLPQRAFVCHWLPCSCTASS